MSRAAERLLIERSEDFYADAYPAVSRVLAFASLPEPPAFASLVRAHVRQPALTARGRSAICALRESAPRITLRESRSANHAQQPPCGVAPILCC